MTGPGMANPPIAAMLLAAGRGDRMRPLTDTTPKPLLAVQGKPLMQWPLEALARSGCARTVVNTAWLGEQIPARFGDELKLQPPSDGRTLLFNEEHGRATMPIVYSHEGQDFGGALETAGGIARALPMLGDVFWVVAGDVFAPDFDFPAQAVNDFLTSDHLAHLWLVPNPAHNPKGDFGLECGMALNLPPADPRPRLTYSTMGLYRKTLFAAPWCDIPMGNPVGIKAALAPLLRAAMDQGHVSAALYTGRWADVGTPQRLAQLNGTDQPLR